MKICRCIWLLFCLFPSLAYGQYFQQEVNYRIEVTLDDSLHTVNGVIEIEYTNNAPDGLDSLYFHLWANAYQDQTSAFARQQLRNGSTRFYFAKDKDLGNFSGLDFQVNQKSLDWRLDPQTPDIAVLHLPTTLLPGERVTIHSPFTLKIPASFSRLGHVDQSYQMTQWFPKPAVYDQEGWHAMPYLDMGEFYSEFGSFDVKITLPENYIVGATGVLQTESEKAFLLEKAQETQRYLDTLNLETLDAWDDPFPPSSPKMKTIHYIADKVHDFAWFADKRFRVQKSEVQLPSGPTVDTWTMFTNNEQELWIKSIDYVNRAVKFYSELVGDYPYPHATAVQSALSAGGGMEYPMITVIGLSGEAQALDEVITHEVGHNWFYGILAFNERDDPWLDEGINSYYDHRYTERYYGRPDIDFLPGFMTKGTEMNVLEAAYLLQGRRNLDQAPATHSDSFTRINYFLGAYEKPAVAFKHLEKYLGTARFDHIMQDFYQQWQFRHPQPEDLRQHFAKHTSQDLAWFFDGFIYSNQKMDYALTGLVESQDSFRIRVKNSGDIAAPFSISGIKGDSIYETHWYEGFSGTRSMSFPSGAYDLILLDAERLTLEINRKNNNLDVQGLLKKVEPFKLKWLGGLENDKRTSVYFFPGIAWNNYDKTMLGVGLYNSVLPAKAVEYQLFPAYGFGSKELVGIGRVRYTTYPNGKIFDRIRISTGIKGFNYGYTGLAGSGPGIRLKYMRITPSLQFRLKKAPTNQYTQDITWRTHILNLKNTRRGNPDYEGPAWETNYIHELRYFGENRRALHPFSISATLEAQSYKDVFGREQHYQKVYLEWQSSFDYQRRRHLDIRIFAGGFLHNTTRDKGAIFPGAFNLIQKGYNDYRFDDFYFGRTASTGIWSQQVSIRDGGFKTVIGDEFALGRSNSFILALNLKMDLPVKLPLALPLKPYLDLGYFDNAMPTGADDTFEDQFLWNGGLMLDFFDGKFGLYFPLVSSRNISDRLAERGNFWTRISYSLNLNDLDPWRLIDRMSF